MTGLYIFSFYLCKILKFFIFLFNAFLIRRYKPTVQMLFSTLFTKYISGSFLSLFENEVKEGDVKWHVKIHKPSEVNE